MRKGLIETLMEKDGLTEDEAIKAVNDCREEAISRIECSEMPYDICEEYFGLEPDYLEDLF